LPLKRECFLASQGSRKNKNLHLHLCNKNQITIFRCKKKNTKKNLWFMTKGLNVLFKKVLNRNLRFLRFYVSEIVNNAYFVNDFFGDKEIIIRAFYPDFSKSFSDIFSNYCICDVKEGNKFIISHIDSISMDDTFVDTFLLVKELDLFDKTISKIINRIEYNEEYKVVEQFKKVLLDKQDDKIFMDYVKKINIFPSKKWTLL
jgi:hypothetical protein